MANIITKSTGSKAIQLVLKDGTRKTVGIGKVTKKGAEAYLTHVEHLLAASIGGTAAPLKTAEWLASVPKRVRVRLGQLDLIQIEEPTDDVATEVESVSASELVERYIDGLEVKPRTIVRYGNQLAFMLRHFQDCTDISLLTEESGSEFLKWLRKQKKKNGHPLAANYIHKIVKTSRQAFDVAVTQKIIDANPLAEVRAPERVNEDRDFEITREMTDAILKVANPKYRLLIALARYGGLRCPSELAGLRWSDILWDQGRFVVHSPKTEHCGKSKRVVPLFANLLPYLRQAHEIAPDGIDDVFPDVDGESNLRTETQRTLIRAGIVEEVPRFYQNCRSTIQTELEEEFPLHVVCKWLGNSERTARKHYLKVRERHFEKATQPGMHESMQNSSEQAGIDENCEGARRKKASKNTDSSRLPLLSKYTREDSNLQHPVPKAGRN